MNLRAYLKILRPSQVIAFAGAEGLFGWILLRLLFPSNPAEVQLLGLLVLAPLIVGRGLLWPLEYALHHGGCAAKPGVDRAFRRAHSVALVIATVVLTSACTWRLSGHPVVLSAGMVVTLLSLPLFFERGSPWWSDSWRMGAVALNAIVAACVLNLDHATQMVVGLVTFAVSIMIAARGFRHCFDRRRILARGRRPYVQYQMLVMVAMGLRQGADALLRRDQEARPRLQTWRTEAMDHSLWSWLKTLFCLRFGNARIAVKSFAWSVVLFGPLLVLVGLGLPLLNPHGSHEGVRSVFEKLRSASPPLRLGDSARGELERMYLILGFVVTQTGCDLLPRYRLPVSRRRYADYACTFSLSVCVVQLVLFFLSASVTLLGVDAVVETSPHAAILYPFALLTLLTVSAMPIALAFGAGIRLALAGMANQLAVYAPLVSIAIAMSVAAVMATLPLHLERQDGPGLPVAFAVFGGLVGAWMYREVLRRDLQRADLSVVETKPGVRI